MIIEVAISCGEGMAHYTIEKESTGIFHAKLLHFEGEINQSPPSNIVICRGVRHWTGSCDDTMLLENLGKALERNFPKSKKTPGKPI